MKRQKSAPRTGQKTPGIDSGKGATLVEAGGYRVADFRPFSLPRKGSLLPSGNSGPAFFRGSARLFGKARRLQGGETSREKRSVNIRGSARLFGKARRLPGGEMSREKAAAIAEAEIFIQRISDAVMTRKTVILKDPKTGRPVLRIEQ